MRLRCALAAAAACAACPVALAAPAEASWLAPIPLSNPDRPGSAPAIAMTPAGGMLAAWTRNDVFAIQRVEAGFRAPGGTLEQAQVVSDGGSSAGAPAIAADAQGNALLMWQRQDGTFQWATRAAGEDLFGAPHTVTVVEHASDFRLAVAPGGAAAAVIVTYSESGMNSNRDYRLRVMTRAPGADFALSSVLDSGTDDGSSDFSFRNLDVGADATGGFFAAWSRMRSTTSSSQSAVKFASRAEDAPSFAVVDVDTGATDGPGGVTDEIVSAAGLGVDAAGGASVAYRLSDGVSKVSLLIASRPPGGSFGGSPETVAPLLVNGPQEPAYDVNAAGAGMLAWAQGSGADQAVWACARPPGGPCGEPRTIAPGNSPKVAIGPGGQAVVAARATDLTAGWAAFRPSSGPFDPPLDLAEVDPHRAEALAVDPLGHAVVGLQRSPPGATFTEALVNDPVAPSIGQASVAATAGPGEPLAFGASVFDVWGPVTATWDFGDASSGPGPDATHAYATAGAYTATLTATDAAGNSATHSVQVTVRDTIRPRILSFGITNSAFAVGPRATPLAARRRPPRGTVFRFRLSEAATARIKIQRKRGRKWKTVGTLKRRAPAAPKRVPFSGRLRRKALALGRYRAVLVATDSAKNKSMPRRLGFTVVRR